MQPSSELPIWGVKGGVGEKLGSNFQILVHRTSGTTDEILSLREAEDTVFTAVAARQIVYQLIMKLR